MKRKIFTAPYGADREINLFGDWDTLVCVATQTPNEIDKISDLRWSLQSWTGAPARPLTDKELHSVLQSFFFQKAGSITK